MKRKVRLCEKQVESDLEILTHKILQELKDKQEQGEARELGYLILFHFRSSLWNNSFQYQICATDETIYLTSPLVSVQWTPANLYNDLEELAGKLEADLRKHFVRLTKVELKEAEMDILESYHKLAEVYWSQLAEKIISDKWLEGIKTKKDWKILSGIYMENLRIVFQPGKGW